MMSDKPFTKDEIEELLETVSKDEIVNLLLVEYDLNLTVGFVRSDLRRISANRKAMLRGIEDISTKIGSMLHSKKH